jgi:hypothetical protein
MDLLSSPARMLTAGLYLAALVAAYFCTAELCGWLRYGSCAPDSFLSRMSEQATLIVALPLGVALGGTWALAIDGAMGGAYLGANRTLAGVAGIAAMLAYPVFLWDGLGNKLCLAPDGIVVRDSRLSPVHAYGWTDVQALAVNCTVGRNQYRKSWIGAALWMRDGAKIKISEDEYVRMHDRLGAALAGKSYRFGPPFVDSTCPAADRAIFSTPP